MINLNWVSISEPKEKFKAKVRIRYNAPDQDAEISVINNIAHIEFDEPQISITPGQIGVIYDGDLLLGGGIIK